MKLILAFVTSRVGILVIGGFALAIILIATTSYLKGRADGKNIALSLCQADKIQGVNNNVAIREKNNEARNNRPDDDGLIRMLENGSF